MSSTSIYASCIICKKVVAARGLHTHYDRTHDGNNSKYSSGNNGKYKLISERAKQKNIEKEKQYNDNPKLCLHCETILPYGKHINRFCGKSCGASYNNTRRTSETRKKQSLTVRNTFARQKQENPNYRSCGNKKGRKRVLVKYSSTKVSFNTCKQCQVSYIHSSVKQITTPSFCSDTCKRNFISDNSRLNPNCGGKRNSKKIHYSGVILDSSYELTLAKELDKHNIKWIRPKFMWYDRDGKKHRYYPDFYLVDHDIYLDPKNDYLIEQDKTKIELVCEQNNVRVYVLNKNQLTLEHISSLFR